MAGATQSDTKAQRALLDETVVEAFRRDGAAKLESVFDASWIERLRAGVDRNIAEPGPYAKHYTPDGKAGFFFGDYCNWQRIPEYGAFLAESPAADLAGQLMGSETVVLFHEHVLVKEPKTEEPTPWHHDQPYYCVEGTMTCSLWVPLDPVGRDTCVEFIAGSHLWGKRFMPAKFKADQEYERRDGDLEPVPDIEPLRETQTILGWDMEPGDAIAFSFLTLHGAPGNTASGHRRRAFAARYVGSDVVFVRRDGEVSPQFPEVTLEHGAPLRGDTFPVVRG